MKVERIHGVEPIIKMQDKDLTEKQFKDTLKDNRKKFQKGLRQYSGKNNEETFDENKARVDADIARLAVERHIKRIDSEEQEK